MGYTIKDGASLEGALNDLDGKIDGFKSTMKEFDDKLDASGGSISETAAIARETQAQVKEFMSRQLPAGAPVELLANHTGKTLTWDAIHKMKTSIRAKSGKAYEFEPADASDLVGQLQDAADQLNIIAGAMKMVDSNGAPDPRQYSRLKFYNEVFVPLREKVAKAAGDAFSHVAGAGGTSGTEWNPTEFSSRLIEKARLPLKVVAIIPSFNMPRSPFLFPVQLADLASYLTAENQASASQTAISDGKGSTVVSGSKTFTSVKLATMAFTSKEIEEDSIVAILPYLEAAVVQAVANALENAVVNGVRTGTTHMDTDVAAAGATDVRKAWHGLRYYALSVASGGSKDASGAYINSDANWRDFVRGARKLMADPFKGDNGKLAMIVSGNSAIDIGSVEAFRYAYAFGQTATNSNPDTTGFKPDGLGSFVVSEFQRGDVDATGVNGASGNTYTTILQFAPQAWLLGMQRNLRVEVLRERYADFDQDAVKITWRGDLQYMLPGNHTVATIGVPAS